MIVGSISEDQKIESRVAITPENVKKFLTLQKDKKNVKEESSKKVVTNNAFFMGSTADLQKMLKQASKKKDK